MGERGWGAPPSPVPGPQKRGTGGTLSVVGNDHWDRGHPPSECAGPEAGFLRPVIWDKFVRFTTKIGRPGPN